MRRPPRRAAAAAARRLRPLLLLLPFAALLCAATFSLHYPDRLGPTTVTVTVTATHAEEDARPHHLSSPRLRLEISRLDFRALNATAPLHAAAARAFRDGGRLLRDALSVSATATATAAPPPRCPSSVARSGEALRAAGGVLALPCGLALGSHVTVVASPRRVPGGGLAQFAVDLRGAGDAEAASTILHFNPRLRGDWSGRPVIELNTRFRGQWGPAQRCEGWRRSDEETVDGLVKCEQWAWNTGGTFEELKRMGLRNRVAGHRSRDLMDWPYPFVEGELFILTISAGLEGYNVQVDGRHVASFPYRIGFILEDATTVQVNGDIEVESMVSGALPTAHPKIVQRNLELLAELKAPPPEEPVELFIGILSAGSHFTERMAVRRSWMSAVRNSSNTMARFFVALNGKREVNEDLKKEADFFRDIIIVPFVDSYDLVVLKTVAICEYAARVVSSKYIMKCDDDTFVRLDSVMAEVKKIPDDKSFYVGNMNYYHRPLREGKWAVSYEEWPRAAYPPYADGPGYIVSSDIANFVVSEMEKGRLNLFKMEDVSVGMWVGQFNGTAKAGVEYVHSARFCQFGCVDDYLTAHYQSPGQMLCLWEKLEQGRPQCCNAR
ncbi:hydroxyproline O-galactosyltransferase GALT5 [Lolium perenne]|uniref:hydroxyproline O-galactosyltransferase GALT5 n=1 Tax=Lolium perenne TaxID=4522 RepID=UPI0021F65CEA|nr:hydroxyproline O-galactosyltransferase GALT5-like [Lolium perenne]